jgi:hypothetical protein
MLEITPFFVTAMSKIFGGFGFRAAADKSKDLESDAAINSRSLWPRPLFRIVLRTIQCITCI